MKLKLEKMVAILLVAFVSFVPAAHAAQEVVGVFGLSHVNSTTALAVWVPVPEGQAVSGVRWYNSDDAAVFPVLSVVAGVKEAPERLALAEPLAFEVAGKEMGWSEARFSAPVASATSGLYVILWLPVGSAFAYAGSGGGAGFGYVHGDGQKRCWITGDGEVWSPFSVEFQVAIEPIFDSGKAGNVRILERPDAASVTTSPNAVAAARESMSTLSVAPNPFNPQTQVKFALARAGVVRLDVFDLRGARVRTLVDEPMEAGMHEIAWDGRNEAGTRVASGVYVVKLESGILRQTASLVLLQ
ncbi:MAG: hypothetical protein DRH37_04330 [Deltaproteobacteria bacterium]|nr:MAG: hypothetical protein DRH37_04330 [Deltaproteobacteria bacterium]